MCRLCVALVLASLIAGCGIARQRELAAQVAALREQSATAMKECGEKFPPGNPKIAVARAQCVNAALAIAQPTLRPIAGLHGGSHGCRRGCPGWANHHLSG